MANRTAALYIRTKSGYRKHGKRLIDLPVGQTYQLFWYEGTHKKAKAVGRFADEAKTAFVNKEAELRRASTTGAALEVLFPDTRSMGRDLQSFIQQS